MDRVAFTEGIVVAKCKHCDAKHLVADNLSKLDFGKGKVGLFNFLSVCFYVYVFIPRVAHVHNDSLYMPAP